MVPSVVAEHFDCVSDRRSPAGRDPVAELAPPARAGSPAPAVPVSGVFDGPRPAEPAWQGQWAVLKYL